MQAVILAGGKGTRLAERLNGRPKPLVDVCGEPLLARQLRTLHDNGITEAVILVNHAADQIADFLAAWTPPFPVALIDDGAPRGTGGATLACLDQLRNRFAVVYGDTLFDIDIQRMLGTHLATQADASLLLHPNDHPFDSDLVEIDGDGWIRAFHPYPHSEDRPLRNLVNAAFYIVEKELLARCTPRDGIVDFAKDLFPALLAEGARLHGYTSPEYIKDLGTPARLDKVERHLREGIVDGSRRSVRQPTVFLDRDGTLNAVRPGDYVTAPDQLVLLPGAADAVRMLNAAAYRVAVVTNQPVLARGDCDAATMDRIMAKLEWNLGRSGAFLDASYLCPHHPHAGFPGEVPALKIACPCRKPGTGLIDQAVADLNVDLAASWLVGDSSADMMLANRCGLLAVLVETGEGGRDGKYAGLADFTVADLRAAADLITRTYPALQALAVPMADRIAPGDLVLVGGAARLGKSSFAAVLRSVLRRRGLAAKTLALDRWIRPAGARSGPLLDRFGAGGANEALAPWFAGSDLSVPVPHYDRYQQRPTASLDFTIGRDEILVLEGVTALLMPIETARTVHRIHVVGDEAGRADRVINDIARRYGGDRADATRRYEERCDEEDDAALRSGYRASMVEISLDAAFGHGR